MFNQNYPPNIQKEPRSFERELPADTEDVLKKRVPFEDVEHPDPIDRQILDWDQVNGNDQSWKSNDEIK